MKRSTLVLLLLVFALFLFLAPAPFVSPVSAVGPQMYVTNNMGNWIARANLDGTGATSLGNLGGLASMPAGIALDVANGKMYVVNQMTNNIVRAYLDGTGGTDLGNPGGLLNTPLRIALDVASGKMYITSLNNNKVVRANLDGTGAADLGNLGGLLGMPTGLALDLANAQMYVAMSSSIIVRANLDGTGATNLGSFGGVDLALDVANGKMYVLISSGRVVRANLDGTGAVDLGNIGGFLNWPTAMALDLANGQMYFTNWYPHKIVRANLDGTGATDLGNIGGLLVLPAGIALDVMPVDTTPPVITITSPQAKEYLHTSTVQVAWNAVDTGSGIASEGATLDGSPVTKGQVIDLFYQSLGAHTVKVTAKDKAGNTNNASVTFTVAANIDSLTAALGRACALGWITAADVCSGLTDKLLAAKAAIGSGQSDTARNQLNAFLNQLEAQNGKAVNAQAYILLKVDAQYVIDHLP